MLEYVAIALMVVLSTVVALIAIGLGYLFGPKKESAAKAMPYEFGHESLR
jgi:NADH:ubiquinone oxidoreductase subunit 3 (subunit A)